MFHRIYSHFPIQTLSTIHLEHFTLSLYRPRCSNASIRIFRSKPLVQFIWNISHSLSIGPNVPDCRNSYLLHENSTTIECRVHVNCSRYTPFAYKTVHSHTRNSSFSPPSMGGPHESLVLQHSPRRSPRDAASGLLASLWPSMPA
jgi:hypothetical protein